MNHKYVERIEQDDLLANRHSHNLAQLRAGKRKVWRSQVTQLYGAFSEIRIPQMATHKIAKYIEEEYGRIPGTIVLENLDGDDFILNVRWAKESG